MPRDRQQDPEPRPSSRYGMDALGILILVAGIVCLVLSFFGSTVDPMLFTLPFMVGIALIIYEGYRLTSTNISARTRENDALLRPFRHTDEAEKERLKKERAERKADAKAQAAERKRAREANRRDDEKARKQEQAAERDAAEHPGTTTEHCPSCSQSLRVPQGKGTLRVTCPKCKPTFVIHT